MRSIISYFMWIAVMLLLTLGIACIAYVLKPLLSNANNEIKEPYYNNLVEWKLNGLLSATDIAPAMEDGRITHAEYNELFEKMHKNRITFLSQ